MRPKQRGKSGEQDLFRSRLDQIINMKHELVGLAGRIDWAWIDGEIAPLYSWKGRPGIETRFVIGLLLLAESLKGRDGDAANVILSAVCYNLRRVLAWLRMLL